MDALRRKARQVLNDPVLRRWLIRRISGKEKPPSGFTVGHPPYLNSIEAPDGVPSAEGFSAGQFAAPDAPITISLPGAVVALQPDHPEELFTRDYPDLETQLAVHRFAWVPLAGDDLNPDWVAVLWACWSDRFGNDRTGWPWHGYTASERAINMIDFSRRYGSPEGAVEFAKSLQDHAAAILGGLEYFGDHYTSNHLSNNGRGLLRIGCAVNLAGYADIGAKIMVAEAGRIFGRSGVLLEGSTHYHLLLARNYIDAWLEARAAGHVQAPLLHEIAERAVAAIPGLCLPGGMPLIGDISPDVPPAYLGRLTGGTCNGIWPNLLADDRQAQVQTFLDACSTVSPDRLADDGWHRFGAEAWQALTFVPPDGWSPMPGHGHYDLGSFELHDGDVPVIIDPGRGSYADFTYESAAVHNGLRINENGPTPENRPYYSDAFRHHVTGSPPEFERTRDGRILHHAGFGHIPSIGRVTREWRFDTGKVQIVDRVEGRRRARVSRRYFTPHTVLPDGEGAVMDGDGATYRIVTGGDIVLSEMLYWTAYGESHSGTMIESVQTSGLPYDAVTTIERL